MKRTLHITRAIRYLLVLAVISKATASVSAQTGQPVGEMTFENPALEPGSLSGTDNGVVYPFAIVTTQMDAFYGGASYTVENNSQLTVSNLLGTLNLPLLNGTQFIGSLTDRTNFDTAATDVMTTLKYTNTDPGIRLGENTTGYTNNANRMYSVWVKNFSYTAPISTLPVKLTALNAALAKDKVNLNWETVSEINVSHFELERSTDGINFTPVAIAFSYGSADTKADYSYSDNVASLQVPVVYYRLCSVDIDGKSEISETRIVPLTKDQANSISLLIYPNPVMNELWVTVPNNWQNKQTVFELFYASGQITSRKATTGNNQTETINTSNLAPGFYVVRVSCEGQTAQQKIVKH